MDFFKIRKFRKGARSPSKEKLNGEETGIEQDGDQEILEAEQNALNDPIFDAKSSNQTSTEQVNINEQEEEDEDDDFITNEVKRRLKELRKNSFMVLIPEEELEEEDEEEEDESSSSTVREWVDSDLGMDGFSNWLCGFDSFYGKYCERMLFFDKMTSQLLKEPGMLNYSKKSPKSSSEKLASTLRSLSFKLQNSNQNQNEDMDQLRMANQTDPSDPFQTLETAYVAQLALSWEALHCQYTQLTLKISSQTENNANYIHAAQTFQQFQVLLVRFIETEPFEPGSRVEIYTKSRAHLSKLLQVPNIEERGDQSQIQSGNENEKVIVATDLMKVLEESILTFRLFLKKDKKKLSGLLGANSINGSSLHQVQASLEKKEMRVKELLKKKKGWKYKMWPNSSEEIELLFAIIDIKVTSRVLRMEKLSKEQLLWCEEKMSKLDLSYDSNKLRRDNSPILFPC